VPLCAHSVYSKSLCASATYCTQSAFHLLNEFYPLPFCSTVWAGYCDKRYRSVVCPPVTLMHTADGTRCCLAKTLVWSQVILHSTELSRSPIQQEKIVSQTVCPARTSYAIEWCIILIPRIQR